MKPVDVFQQLFFRILSILNDGILKACAQIKVHMIIFHSCFKAVVFKSMHALTWAQLQSSSKAANSCSSNTSRSRITQHHTLTARVTNTSDLLRQQNALVYFQNFSVACLLNTVELWSYIQQLCCFRSINSFTLIYFSSSQRDILYWRSIKVVFRCDAVDDDADVQMICPEWLNCCIWGDV